MNFKVLLAAGALLATQSFAIIGIGAHYAPGFGSKMNGLGPDKIANRVSVSDGGEVKLWHGGFDEMMQGFGFKLWIDILPIIDIEATFNIQFGSYDATLFVVNDPMAIISGGTIPNDAYKQIDLEVELGGTPFGKANPKFVAMTGDLSITYPITFIPIIRPYIGGGLTVFANSFVLNQAYVSSLMDPTLEEMVTKVASQQGITPEEIQQQQQELQKAGEALKQRVQEKAAKESIKTSIGGHALVGFRLKLPIIPIAAYCNFKYYFGGDYPEEIDPGHMTLEVGGGLAI